MISSLTALLGQAAPGSSSSGGGPFGGGGGWMGILPWIMIFGIFYFLLIRPQQKKARDHTDWLKSLKKGDEVVTTGGLIGKISGLTELFVTLELQEKVRVRVLRSHIAGKPPAPGQAPEKPAQEASK